MKTKVSMNSAETWDILLYGETSKVNAAKLKALLVDFMTTYVNSEEDAFKILPSDLFTVSSLLVQKLIKQIRHAFITPDGNNTKPNVGVYSVVQFLKQDINCYLMLTLSLVCHKVSVYYPELAELVLVILKSALCSTTDFMQCCDDSVLLTPVYDLVTMGTQPESDQNKSSISTEQKKLLFYTPRSFLSYLIEHICVKKEETFNFLNNFRFCLLLLSLYEGLCYKGDLYSMARLPDCIQQLQSVTNLLNDVINHWSKCCLQLKDSGTTLTNKTTLFYVTAILVRVWLSIPVQFPHITTAEDLKTLVAKPLTSIISACVNLKVNTYDSNPILGQEFGIVALEVLYAALCYVDICSQCPSHSLNVITPFVENILTDECNSIFLYLVSKLCISSVFASSKEGEGKEIQLLVAGIIDRLTSAASYISSERNRYLKPSTEKVRNGSTNDGVNLVESEVMIRNISKFAMTLFGICGDLPDIQISLIRLLSQTVCDPVVIIETFLPSLPARLPSFFDNPSILSLYLDLLEKAWFQQSSDVGGDSSWWEILMNYLKLLQCSDHTIVLEILYHIQCILGHSSVPLKTHLCRFVVGPFLNAQLKLFKDGVTNTSQVNSNERKRYNSFILLLLKLFHKVVSDESCLQLLADAGIVQLIFVLLLSKEFCDNTVKLLQTILLLNTECKARADLSPPLKTIILQVMHSILKIVISLSSTATIKKVVLSMVDSSKPLRSGLFTLVDIDSAHRSLVKQFENTSSNLDLIKEEFYSDFQICSSLWDVIACVASKDEWLLKYLTDSHLWELVKVMAPSLGNFLTHSRQVGGTNHSDLVERLQKTCVIVLCKQLQLACCFLKSKESQKAALAMFLKDVQESLQGSLVMDIPNGHKLCSELLNCSTILEQPKQAPHSVRGPLNQPSQNSTANDVITAGRKKLHRKKRSRVELSTIGHTLYPTLDDAMEMSGYDADIEREAIVGKVDKDSLPPQDGYLGKITFFSPVFNALNLIHYEASPELTASCACNIELFLRHLLLLLLSCDENCVNCANKGVLAHVLHCCSAVFGKRTTTTTLRCCDLIAEIALTLNKEKLSIQEAKQLVISFQNNKELLERLPSLLYRLTDTPFHPTSYVQFSYPKPQTNCDTADLISIPSILNITSFTTNGISSTLWLCVTKCSFPVVVHIVSYPIDEHCFLQMWACCFTGNIIISITGCLDWKHIGDDVISSSSSITVFGSVITLNAWNHLVVSTCRDLHHRNDVKNFKLSVSVDGEEFNECTLEVSQLFLHDKGKICYLAGGATSEHTKDESLELLEASSQQISWKLGSFVIYQGCINSKLAQHLYMLGPNCASSDLRTLQLCGFPLQASQLSSSTRVSLSTTRTIPIQNIIQMLENPLVAYSGHDCTKASSWQYAEHISPDRQKQYLCFPQIERVMLSPAAQRCARIISQVALISAVGISGILYLYAKVVEVNCSEESQAGCLRLLILMMKRLPHTRAEFEEIGGVELVQQVLRTPQATVGYKIADVLFTWCCEGANDNNRVTNIDVLKHVLLDWHIWHKAPEGTWSYVLNKLTNWINPSCECFQENILQFRKSEVIAKILLTSKERLIENLPPLPADIVKLYVNLVGLLFGSPPNLECFSRICDHLLVPDLNDVKFVSLSRQESSFPLFETSEIPVINKSDETRSSPYTLSHVSSDPGFNVASGSNEEQSQQQLRSQSDVFNEQTHPEFDVQPSADRIPFSSYNSEDHTPFSWVNVTGLVPLREGNLEDVPASLEVGLLAELRKQILLLPDGQVKRTFGKIINPECLLTMVNNKSILIRTAVIRVLDEYFNRAPESTKMEFIAMKGFDLLAWQLSKFTMSLELIIALLSIILGGRIDQRSFLSGTVSIPEQLTGFQMHAVIPLLKCLMNTVSQPLLCHASLTVLLQLFQNISGMPVFLHEHGLLKMLCQLTVVASNSMKSEDSELILKDIFSFCKLIAFLAASSSQDNILGIMESLLVCLKWCKEKVEQEKDKNSKAVLYLHFLHCKTLQSTLKMFCENLEPTNVPTLSVTDQLSSSSSNLSNHFLRVAIAAVDTVVFSTHAYKTEQVGLFISKDLSLPTGIRPNSKANVMEFTLAFTKFLLYYFHKALIADPKKSSSLSNINKYANTHRHSLYEQYARILGCLCLPQHDTSFHCVVLEEFSEMEDSVSLLTTLLNHATLRKRLASRLILTIVNILTALPNLMDSPIYLKLNSLYEAIVKTTSTGLRQSTRLTSLLLWQQEADPRNKQKLELAIDEMRNNDQRWRDRHEHDSQAYDDRNKKLFIRILDKMESHYQSIISISDEVSSQVMKRQNDLRQHSLQQMNSVSRKEHEILGAWRKIVLHNTHPCALWSDEEKRVMCWQLDPTEGPCRERRRLMQVPRNIEDKYVLDEGAQSAHEARAPLSFIFENTVYHANSAFSQKIARSSDEKIIVISRCQSISQDSCVNGYFIITTHRFLFHGDKPLDDPSISTLLPWDSERALLSWEHNEVVEVHRRRYSLKDDAMEIFLINGITMLLSFDSTKDRNMIHNEILNLGLLNIIDSGESDGDKVRVLVDSWQQGEITNFEYLVELNKLAGRTFNDLMQYPVMPFILADYHSNNLDLNKASVFRKFHLPISIQDLNKRQKYLDTYTYLHEEYKKGLQLNDPNPPSKPYHYGSHYSNSGIVLHFLVRVPPFTQMFLSFQGNSFDIPDRTFHHLGTTWKLSSSESTSDVKELIPEFFYFPEFLLNRERFKFGERQSGERVDHVTLPPWSNNDPRLFILKHRQALECDYVSSHLHEWVDLVFGYRQIGKAAIDAVNVFHPATYYEEGFDIDKITDMTQQAALRAMVKTYGQMPRQLFKEPHPARNKMTVFTTFRIRIGTVLKRLTADSVFDKLENPYIPLYISPCKPRLKQPSIYFIGDSGRKSLEVMFVEPAERYPSSLLYLSESEGLIIVGASTAFFPMATGPQSSLLLLWSLWDNSVDVKSFTGKEIKLHHSLIDKILCCEMAHSGQLIILAGSLGLVYCWSITNTSQKLSADSLTILRGHEAAVKCMSACRPFGFVVTGSDDCTCIIWDTNRVCYVNSLRDHEGPVTAVATSPTLGDIVTVCKQAPPTGEESAAGTSSGCVLRLWSINGTLVNKMCVESEITCLAYTTAPEGVYVNVIATGMKDGRIRLWSSWDLSLIRDIVCPHQSPVKVVSLVFSSCSKELYAGYANKTIVCWTKPDDSEVNNNGYVLVDRP